MSNVTVYTSPTCGFCKMAKEFFKEKSITYTEKDVTSDSAAYKVLTEKYQAQGVPLIVIEANGKEEIIHGFDQSKINSALGLA